MKTTLYTIERENDAISYSIFFIMSISTADFLNAIFSIIFVI